MREVRRVRQDDLSYHARWFTAAACELFVWQHRTTGQIARFQFCFDRGREERILEWSEQTGLRYAAVDDGESGGPMRPKASPIVIADGVPDTQRILDLFDAHSDNLGEPLRDSVGARLRDGLATINRK